MSEVTEITQSDQTFAGYILENRMKTVWVIFGCLLFWLVITGLFYEYSPLMKLVDPNCTGVDESPRIINVFRGINITLYLFIAILVISMIIGNLQSKNIDNPNDNTVTTLIGFALFFGAIFITFGGLIGYEFNQITDNCTGFSKDHIGAFSYQIAILLAFILSVVVLFILYHRKK